MKRREWLQIGVAVGAAALGGAACKSSSGKLKIAVIPKGTTHEFWKTVHAGAVKASRELDVEIAWKGPLKEDDLKEQADIVESFVAEKISGIVLAPLHDKGLVAPVKLAKDAGIPTVIFDSALQGGDPVSFVATDNVAAGKLGGERLVKLLGGKGNVIVLRYQEGSASTSAREEGCLGALKAATDLKIVSDNQFAGATTESASKAAETLLVAQGADKDQVQGVFCPNESTTFGMLLALDRLGLAGKVKLVGFDSSEKLVAGLRDGKVDALVVQDPMNMGYLAVKTIVAHLKGTTVEKVIDTGARVVEKADMDSAEVKALLNPDLKTYLGE